MTVASEAELRNRVAEVLRVLALDEGLKDAVGNDPMLTAVARRVARRYIAGESIGDAATLVRGINERGDRATVDYMGESSRDAAKAEAETTVFVELSDTLAREQLDCSISLDLSHVGLAIDDELCMRNATRIAETTAGNGQEMIISMEGIDRTDAILHAHARLCEHFNHVGVTIQARLHRTADDLPVLLDRPGRIRLVKGAYPMPEAIAYPRESDTLHDAYLAHAGTLLRSGHACSIATHDVTLLDQVQVLPAAPGAARGDYEFETLLGLGAAQLANLRQGGHPTREYVVFGNQWWLYTCNRIAEDPTRLFQAVIDGAGLRL
jgi:proline dehydrogenase